MRVTETTLQQLLGGPKQFRVPLFQRTYTWKERDHAQLWRDILAQYELSRAGAELGQRTGGPLHRQLRPRTSRRDRRPSRRTSWSTANNG